MGNRHLALSCFVLGTILSFTSASNSAAPFAYVANAGSITSTENGSVSVIDLATNAVTATIETGSYPVGSAVSQLRSLVYITNYNSRTVSVISVATNTVVATVPLAARPGGIAVNAAGTRAYVALQDGTVSVIDTATNSVTATFPVGTSQLNGIVVDPSGKFAYAADFTPKMIRVIDLTNLRVLTSVALAGNPFAVAVHPNGRFVYVTTENTNVRTVAVIDTTTNAIAATVDTPVTALGIAVNPAGTSVYVVNTNFVTNSASITAISTATNAIVASVPAAHGSFTVGFHPDGSRAYVTNESSNTVLVIDTASLSTVATIPVGANPGTYGDFIACAAGQVFVAGGCGAPDLRVVEYINTLDFPLSPGGHFFYTNDPAEQASVDAGAAGRFSRTGNAFNAGGTKQLCRFFGSITPGPNSHFFTINDPECNALKAAQVIPTPTSVQQWNYEGLIFSETPAVVSGAGVTSCPSSTVPVYRFYNNAFRAGTKNPWDSNHRYGTDKASLETFAAANNWAAEGIVFCAAP